MLGLPDGIRGCQFALDGVLTKTAKAHDAAWQEMFDGYLQERARQSGQPFVPFDPVADCGEYAGGTRRAEGTRSFLKSRRVAPGRAGGFGFVVGVDRAGQVEALNEHGADIVVAGLAELLDCR